MTPLLYTARTAARKSVRARPHLAACGAVAAVIGIAAHSRGAPMPLSPGDRAPDFDLPTDNGRVALKDLEGKVVVLYFYPKDDTSGCTAEARGFTDAAGDFGK